MSVNPSAPPDDSRAGRSWVAGAAGLLVLAGAAAYANGLDGPFVFDDVGAIAENASIRRLDRIGDVLLSADYATVVSRPLLNLSLALNYAAGGLGVAGYHLVNIALHLCAGLALFGVVRRTLLAPLAPLGLPANGLALTIALIWTVHPLQTESVSYVCQRAESIAGLLTLLTLYCAIRGGESPRQFVWTAAAVAACFVAAATKETAVAAPIVVLLHDRAFRSGSFREALRRRPGLYAGLAASWILLGALVLSSGGRSGTAGFGHGVGALEYAATQPGAIVDYLRLSFWPHPLVIDRGARLARGAAEIVPYAAAVLALVAAAIVLLVKRPQLGFAAASFFVILAPTSSVVPLVTQTEAEHRMYLPLAAVTALAVLGAWAGLRTRVSAAARRGLVAAVVVAFAIATHFRNATYADPLVLWREAAEAVPGNARAHMGYGKYLLEEGRPDAAIARLDLAVALAPRDGSIHMLRGTALSKLRRFDEATAEMSDAITLGLPCPWRGYDRRGTVRQAQGRHDLAIADFDASLALAPDFADAYAHRAASRLERGDHEGAAQDMAACRRLGFDPGADLSARVARAWRRSE